MKYNHLIAFAAALLVLLWAGVHVPTVAAAGCGQAALQTSDQACTVDLSDYFQRHREVLQPRAVVDLSDYFQRHPEVLKPGNALSDYFQRHPELLHAEAIVGSPAADIKLPQSPSSTSPWHGGWRPGR
jgi:hypothetical protein